MQLDHTLKIARQRPLLRVAAHQRVGRKTLFQIFHDDQRLDQIGTVLEFEHGQRAEGIARQVLRLAMAALECVDHDLFDPESAAQGFALGDVEHDLGRVRC